MDHHPDFYLLFFETRSDIIKLTKKIDRYRENMADVTMGSRWWDPPPAVCGTARSRVVEWGE